MVRTGTTSRPAMSRRDPPRLPGLPLLGSALDLRRDYLGTLLRAQATGADVVRLGAGPRGWRTSLYTVFAPDGIERVLANAPDRLVRQTPGYVELRNTIGDGLLTSEGDTWHRQRRLVAPAFTRRRMVPGYAAAVTREATDVVARWAPAAAGSAAVDAHAEMLTLTARVIGRVLFGTDVGDALPRLTRIGPFVNALLLRRSVSPHPSPRWLPTRTNARLAAASAEMRDIVDGIVAQRSRELDEQAQRETRAGRRQGNLLDLLLSARAATDGDDATGEPLTDDQVADQVLVFLLAGHETTATTLACALVLLAWHPEWQRVLQEEVDAVAGDRPVSGADVPALVQVDHVVRETLRLYPAAHTIGRRAPHGDVLLGNRIPRGGNVIVSPWATQRSPALWPQAHRFDPERFAVPDPARPRCAWFPFGAGPHACVGAQLAMLEATMALATLVQAYQLDTGLTDIPLLAGISLRPAAPLPVRLTARKPAVPHDNR